jgi:hypothetical protein
MITAEACIEAVKLNGIAGGFEIMADMAAEPTVISNRGYLLAAESMVNLTNLRVYADGNRYAWNDCIAESVHDPILERNGIRVFKILELPETSNPCDELRLLIDRWVLGCRLGIAFRMLERLMSHLSNRVSFGQKTHQHQMIKQAVSEFLVIFTSLRTQLDMPTLTSVDRKYMHEELDLGMKTITRLMGGHGFLSGGIHDDGYISDFIKILYRMEHDQDG